MTDTHLTDPRQGTRDNPEAQVQRSQPGLTEPMTPTPDHGEESYVGNGRLTDRRALITGGDSGIGRAVAVAFAREGADVAFTHLAPESADAESTAELVKAAGRAALPLEGDLRHEGFAERIVDKTIEAFGGLDLLVLNAAYQRDRPTLEDVSREELLRVLETNLVSLVATARTALPHLKPGASVIVTSSIQAFNPSPNLVDYAMTKAAQVAFVRAMAEEWGPLGIRVNAVAPGPIWTPPHSGDRLGRRQGREFRAGHPVGATRSAGRSRRGVCLPRLRCGLVCLGSRTAGDGREAPVRTSSVARPKSRATDEGPVHCGAMGQFIYGRVPTSVEVEDRALAHLRVVIATKLRRGEPLFLELDAGTGSGRRSFWLHPGIALQFHFYGSRQPVINRAWIDALMESAHSATGLHVVPEPSSSGEEPGL